MGDTQMAELRALEAAATPGPWRVCRETDDFGGLGMPVCRMDGDDALTVGNPMDWGPTAPTDTDAVFIAAARNALPALLARVERLEAALRAVMAHEDELDCRGVTWHIANDALAAVEPAG